VALLGQISDILKKNRAVAAACWKKPAKAFVLDVVREEEGTADENLSIDRITTESDISPIIRLVDTTIFTALPETASDIHIE